MISKEDNPMKMKKRLIGIIGIVVTIVLVMLVVVMLNKGKDKQQPQLEETDNKTQTAEDLAPYTSMDVDKIDGLLNTELTDEQIAESNRIQTELTIPNIVEIQDEDPTDNKYTGIDDEGNIYEIEDPILNMTDEEAQEFVQSIIDDPDNGGIMGEQIEEIEDGQPDQDLLDAGFEATPSESGEDGYIYTNPNVIDDGSQVTDGSEFNNPSDPQAGMTQEKKDNAWDIQGEIYG